MGLLLSVLNVSIGAREMSDLNDEQLEEIRMVTSRTF
jgi:hypothetical protein